MVRRTFDLQDEDVGGISRDSLNALLKTYGFPTRDFLGQDVLFSRSLTSVTKYVRDSMRDKVPERSGDTKASIKTRNATRTRPARVTIDTPLWHILEWGREAGESYNRRYEKITPYPGMKPRPYIFPVLNGEQPEMVRAFRTGFEKNLRQFQRGNKRLLKMLKDAR